MKTPLFAVQAFEKLKQLDFETVWDIGSGDQRHAQMFRALGKEVYTVDSHTDADIKCFYPDIPKGALPKPDLIWSSHCLEHQRNVGRFLDGCHRDLKEGGILAITVPPLKDEIVGGHLTLWNAGLLLYNLIMARFDCSHAMVKKYDYNISVIVRKKTIRKMPALTHNAGDIELLAKYFPMNVHQGFYGDIEKINW